MVKKLSKRQKLWKAYRNFFGITPYGGWKAFEKEQRKKLKKVV